MRGQRNKRVRWGLSTPFYGLRCCYETNFTAMPPSRFNDTASRRSISLSRIHTPPSRHGTKPRTWIQKIPYTLYVYISRTKPLLFLITHTPLRDSCSLVPACPATLDFTESPVWELPSEQTPSCSAGSVLPCSTTDRLVPPISRLVPAHTPSVSRKSENRTSRSSSPHTSPIPQSSA